MNIFFLALLAEENARYHCDKHVVKMILESTQLLWSVWHLAPPCLCYEANKTVHISCAVRTAACRSTWQSRVPAHIKVYRVTHAQHPMAIWARSHPSNYVCLLNLALALCAEYTYRYRTATKTPIHACQVALEWMREHMSRSVHFARAASSYKAEQVFAQTDNPAGCTPVPLCMPEICQRESLIAAYRAYYLHSKAAFLAWRRRPRPDWVPEEP